MHPSAGGADASLRRSLQPPSAISDATVSDVGPNGNILRTWNKPGTSESSGGPVVGPIRLAESWDRGFMTWRSRY
jgi:hypothetical protein